MTLKLAMGVFSIIVTLAAYAIYLWGTVRANKIQPHPFSWLLWSLVTGVAYLVQKMEGAGPGSWVSGLTAAICLVIGVVSLTKRRWRFSSFDWLSLAVGLLVFLYYVIEKNPTISAILATVTDVIGYGSTLKKGWSEPHNDSAISFALNSFKFVPAIWALQSYSVATVLYPATLVVVNGGVAYLLIRRRQELEVRRSNGIRVD